MNLALELQAGIVMEMISMMEMACYLLITLFMERTNEVSSVTSPGYGLMGLSVIKLDLDLLMNN
jgi:hypothetical protein